MSNVMSEEDCAKVSAAIHVLHTHGYIVTAPASHVASLDIDDTLNPDIPRAKREILIGRTPAVRPRST